MFKQICEFSVTLDNNNTTMLGNLLLLKIYSEYNLKKNNKRTHVIQSVV